MNPQILRQDLDLMLPDNLFEEWDEDTFNRYLEGQQAISDFLELKLTSEELIEFLADVARVNIDSWLDCVNYNINH